jgi:hypothetical protein
VPADDGVFSHALPTTLSESLDGVERACSTSYFSVRLAAVAAHVLETTGRRDLLVGVHVTSRRLPELQQLIGLFAYLTPVRLRVEGAPSFRDFVAQVRAAISAANEHFALPYGAFPWAFRGTGIGVPSLDLIVGGERTPLPWAQTPLADLEARTPVRPRPAVNAMPRKFDLLFRGRTGADESETCLVRIDARRYDPELVRGYLDAFAQRAAELCAEPDAPLQLAV